MESTAEMSVKSQPVCLLYHTTQGARTTAVHRNPEMGINGYDTLGTERLDYLKVPFFSSFSFMKNPL